VSHQRQTFDLSPVTSMLKPALAVLCMVCASSVQAELSTTVLIRLPQADESIIISVDRPVYFPGDTVRLSIDREDAAVTAAVTPILYIRGTALIVVTYSPSTKHDPALLHIRADPYRHVETERLDLCSEVGSAGSRPFFGATGSQTAISLRCMWITEASISGVLCDNSSSRPTIVLAP